MSMLEKMARQVAQDALERVKPDTYTSVVDGVGLYQMLDGNYQVGERLGAGDDDAPGISFETARETMVAMMATQAGAIVVVPEEAPMDPHLVQIAQLLVNSADVPTDEMSTADEANIVQTVNLALDWLARARVENAKKGSELRDALAKVQHAREDVPALIAEVRSLRAKLDAVPADAIRAIYNSVPVDNWTRKPLGAIRRWLASIGKQVSL
jgi:hypothetical protein